MKRLICWFRGHIWAVGGEGIGHRYRPFRLCERCSKKQQQCWHRDIGIFWQ